MASSPDQVLVDEKVPAEEPQQNASLSKETTAFNPTGINEKALVRKLDYKLLPPVTLLYLLSFLDRSNGESR